MAVYTKLEKEEINNVLLNYKVGKLKNFEGIKEGIENTNYFIETEKGKYILTIYERLVKETDLPFFSNLMFELSKNGFICPKPILLLKSTLTPNNASLPVFRFEQIFIFLIIFKKI